MQAILQVLVNAALTDVATLERGGAPAEQRGKPAGEWTGPTAGRRQASMGVVVLGHVSAAVVHLEGCSVRIFGVY